MSWSVSTLGVFVFLLPGLLLRFFVYHESLVKRAILSANPLHASLSVILFALAVHFVAALALLTGADLVCRAGAGCGALEVAVGGRLGDPGAFVLAHPGAVTGYLLLASVVAFALAKLFVWLAGWSGFAARILHGPLAALAQAGRIEMVTCFVLTTIGHENRQVIYSGFPEEIGLKDGAKIDYLVLRAPEKFYLRKNRGRPETSFLRARKISRPYARGFLFIAGGQIENVHFESWSF